MDRKTSRLVGLNGLTRSGKDTLADELVRRQGFVKMAFADAAYEQLSEAFNASVADLRSVEWKTKPQRALQLSNCTNTEFVKLARKMGFYMDDALTSRKLIQTYATEYRRKLYGNDYWACIMMGRVREAGYPDLVLSDVREDVEAGFAWRLVGKGFYASLDILEIVRPGAARTGHSSDSGLSRIFVDATIVNSGSVDELFEQAQHKLAVGQGERRNG